jgi:hypothetical protein
MRNLSKLVAISLLGVLIAGCETNPIVVGASKIQGVKEFYLEPANLDKIVVDDLDESQFKAQKNPDQIESWEADKIAIKERFTNGFKAVVARAGITISDQPTGHYVIRPTVSVIDTGYYRIPAWAAITRLHIKIVILDPNGAIVDETAVHGSKNFDALTAASTGGRLRDVADDLGGKYARYLKKRVAP